MIYHESGAARVALPASAIVYAAVGLGLFAMWPTASRLAQHWMDILDYEHGFIIAAVSVAWLLLRHGQIDEEKIRPRLLVSIGLLAALFLWLIAYRGISQMTCQLLLPVILWLAVLAAAGDRVAKRVAAPLGYLYFAVPVWDYFVPALQQMTVAASEFGLGLIGVPAKVVGDTVTIPEGTFDILEGCSGKRYFLVTMAFASLVGVLNRLPPRRQVVLFLGSVAAALVANWIRVIVVIYAGHVTRMQHYWVSVEHGTMGTVVFGILLAAVLVLARWLASSAPVAADSIGTGANARVPVILPASVWLPLAMLGTLGCIVILWPSVPSAGAAHLAAVPVLAERWNGPMPAGGEWRPYFAGSVDEVRVAYGAGSGSIEVYVNLYADQSPGHKLVYYENTILTPRDWTQVEGPRWWTSIAGTFGGTPMALIAQSKSGERWVVEYVYVVAGHMTTNALYAQLLYGAMSLAGPVGSGVVALAQRCETNCSAAYHSTSSFWDAESGTFALLIPRRPPRAFES